MAPIEGIKVFRINSYDWYAGRTLEECIKFSVKYTGKWLIEYPEELTDQEMDEYKLTLNRYGENDDIGKSFREVLHGMIQDGQRFPCLFAECG